LPALLVEALRPIRLDRSPQRGRRDFFADHERIGHDGRSEASVEHPDAVDLLLLGDDLGQQPLDIGDLPVPQGILDSALDTLGRQGHVAPILIEQILLLPADSEEAVDAHDQD
jgi:hypothetical protein